MYMVAFCYPNGAARKFDYDHLVNKHLPLGVGLTHKHLGIKPLKIVAYCPVHGRDNQEDSSPYSAITNVYFEKKEEAEKFLGLFNVEEAARLLSEDFPNYTPGPPSVLLARVSEITDMDALVDQFAHTQQQ